jgi:prepilin-type N-terminal cleavage/methylation domain-containing protein
VKRRGFTLIEVVLSLSLLGIIMLIAMPRFDLLSRRVATTERQLNTTLSRAQQMAVTRQHDVNVLFDAEGSAMILHADGNGNGVRDPGEAEWRFELEPGVHFLRGAVPAGPPGNEVITFLRRLDNLPVLTFHRSGSVSEAGGFYLGTARSAGGERPGDARMIVVDRGTGLVRRFHLKEGAWHSN